MDFDQLFSLTKTVLTPEGAGVTGSIVGAKFVPAPSWLERFLNLALGAACAAFVAPAVVEWLHVSSRSWQMAVAFVIGVFGLSLCSAVIDGIKKLDLATIISGWISKKG